MDAVAMDRAYRWMIRRDLDEILWIEDRSFDEPWDRAEFLECLRLRNVIGVVQESGGQIVGYAVYELGKRSIDVWTMAIHPYFRRRGNGRDLLWHLKRKLNAKRRFLDATISERNLGGQLFFRSCGWRCIEIVDGLHGEGHDGYMFRFVGDYQEYTHA